MVTKCVEHAVHCRTNDKQGGTTNKRMSSLDLDASMSVGIAGWKVVFGAGHFLVHLRMIQPTWPLGGDFNAVKQGIPVDGA